MRLILLFQLAAALLFAGGFISADKLQERLGSADLVIIDTGSKDAYTAAHIPGAVRTDIAAWRTKVAKHMELRGEEELLAEMQRLGINDNSLVVLYGHNEGKDTLKASYIAFAMATMGFENSLILDGSYYEWHDDEARPVKSGEETRDKGKVTPRPNPSLLVKMDYVKANIGKLPMLDARPVVYYFGTLQSKGVGRLGHISGAVSSAWKDKFLIEETLQSQDVLEKIFIEGCGLEPEKEVILYCTGGLEASMNWFLLYRHMGFKKARLYDASMREWGNQTDTPMTQYKWECFAQ